MDRRLLIAAPSAPLVYELTGRLAHPGTQIKITPRSSPALAWIADGHFDIVLVAPQLDDRSGLTVVRAAQTAQIATVALISDSNWPPPCSALLEEATDSLRLPDEWWRLELVLKRASENQRLRPATQQPPDSRSPLDSLIAHGPAMRSALEIGHSCRNTRDPVLITGGPGTGRTTFAQALAASHSTPDAPQAILPIADLPEELIDDILAGRLAPHSPNGQRPPSTCRQADTLILDDLHTLTRPRQSQLLDLLDQSPAPPRLIATACDASELGARAHDGRLLKPLLERFPPQHRIALPNLADRSSADRHALAAHFLHRHDPSRSLAPDLLNWLDARDWTGNLTELDDFLALLVSNHDADRLRLDHLPGGAHPAHGSLSLLSDADYERPWAEVLHLAIERIESAYFNKLVALCQGRIDRCAQRSGLSRRGVNEKFSRLDIDKADYRPPRNRGAS